MTSRSIYAIWICLALACGSVLAEEIRWAPDIASARRASMEFKVPVLIHFYGDHCLPCKLLEQNVYSKPEVVSTLNKYYICVQVNASQERQTAAEYGVHSWPTDVFVSPDGKVLYQGNCKTTMGDYLGTLQNVAVMNRDRNIMLAAEQSQKSKQVTSQTMLYPAATATANSATRDPSQLTSHLPAAGIAPVANPNGPNFYQQPGVGAGQAALPQSMGPGPAVASGPMLVQNQPHALTTAVQTSGNQIAPGSAPQQLGNAYMYGVQGQPQIGSAMGSAQNVASNVQQNITNAKQDIAADIGSLAQQNVANFPSVPAMTQATAEANQLKNAWGQTPTMAAQPQSQMLDNPHFQAAQNGVAAANQALQNAGQFAQNATANLPSMNSMPTLTPPAQSTPATTNPGGVAASPVSFQPRGAVGATAAVVLPTATPANAASKPNPESLPASLDGYCPVALKNSGSWVKGDEQFVVKHRGRIYRLSNQKAMDEFLASPDKSSPILSGYDPMVFLNQGKLVEGSTQHVLHEQTSGTILLFSSQETKQAYEQDFDRNSKAIDVLLKSAGIK